MFQTLIDVLMKERTLIRIEICLLLHEDACASFIWGGVGKFKYIIYIGGGSRMEEWGWKDCDG